MNKQNFIDELHRIESAGISRAEMARLIPCSKGSISDWMNGKHVPDEIKQRAILQILNKAKEHSVVLLDAFTARYAGATPDHQRTLYYVVEVLWPKIFLEFKKRIEGNDSGEKGHKGSKAA